MNNAIIIGTTPTIKYKFHVVDVSTITTAILTVEKNGRNIVERDLTTATVGEDFLSWDLEQEETLQIGRGGATIMLNWLTDVGKRGASAQTPVRMDDNHIREVIE